MAHVHDHSHHHHYVKRTAKEIDKAVAAARDLARGQAKSLTAQRESVLRLLLEAEKPLGAYELMARLGEEMGKPVAPPTVYRALDFLMGLGAIARIESRNEFLPCAHPDEDHDCMFLVCTCCGSAVEIDGGPLIRSIDSAAKKAGFRPEHRVVEIRGRCDQCR